MFNIPLSSCVNGLFLAWVLRRWESEAFCDGDGSWSTQPAAPEHEPSKGPSSRGPFALSPSHALNTCQCEDENRHSGDSQVLETSNCVKSFRDGNKVCCPSPSFTANATWPSKTTSGLSFLPSERWPWFYSLEWGARDRYTDRLS